MIRIFLWLIAVSQLALGLLTLFLPGPFFGAMGLTVPPPDNGYMLGMLGARFLAYGVGMAMLARQRQPDRFWLSNMLAIQLIDFTLGAVYLSRGLIGPATAAFPMANAALFSAGLAFILARPRRTPALA